NSDSQAGHTAKKRVIQPKNNAAHKNVNPPGFRSTFIINADKVKNVFDHGKAHADNRPINNTVQGTVNFVAPPDKDAQQGDSLNTLLYRWRNQACGLHLTRAVSRQNVKRNTEN